MLPVDHVYPVDSGWGDHRRFLLEEAEKLALEQAREVRPWLAADETDGLMIVLAGAVLLDTVSWAARLFGRFLKSQFIHIPTES